MAKPRVTFPRMGAGTLVVQSFLSELGFDVILPPPITRETLALGGRLAPEFACLPLKVNLGNYLQAIPAGVDAIFMAGGIGPCRFGLYGEVQREILRGLGHEVPFIVFEPPEKHLSQIVESVTRFLGTGFWQRLPRAVLFALKKAAALDRIERLILAAAPEIDPARRPELWREKELFMTRLASASSLAGIHRILADTTARIAALPRVDSGPRLRVMLVGEMLVVIEPAVNFELERRLSQMGVEVRRTIFIYDWIQDHIIKSALKIDWQKCLRTLARPYLSRFIGGHGLETVAHTVEAARDGYDGVIQLAPLGCMPEVTALDIIKTVSRDTGIPVLSLLLDEHTSETGYLTRIEAFVDLMGNKRRAGRGQPWSLCG